MGRLRQAQTNVAGRASPPRQLVAPVVLSRHLSVVQVALALNRTILTAECSSDR